MCNTRYKSCVNRYKQNSIYITCVILGYKSCVNIYKQNSIYITCVILGYKSCVNRYKQNSIYITCVIQDISHVSIDISRIASTLHV